MGGGKEDADDLTNVGGNQVADELLHVGIDSTALLDGGDDGGEVVVGKNHLRGRLGDSGSTAHGNTDLSLLQGRRVVDTVSSHSGDVVHALQVLDNLGLVERLHSGEHARVLAAHLLLRGGVTGGEGKAPEGVATSSVLDGALHNLRSQLLSHGHLLAADPDVGATVKDSLRGSLHEHLGSVSDPGGLLGGAVAGHALPGPGELKSEVLLPLAVHVLLHNLGLLEASSGL